MRILAIGLLAASLIVPAKADTLTIYQCLDIYAGLRTLDHYDDPATGRPKQYKLNGATRFLIGRNMAKLKPISEMIDKISDDLIADIGNGKPFTAFEQAQKRKYNEELYKAVEKPCDVSLDRIKSADLNPDDNALPPSAISSLVHILDP